MFLGYFENKANRGREVRRVCNKTIKMEGYSETRTKTLNQKTSSKPIGEINPELRGINLALHKKFYY